MEDEKIQISWNDLKTSKVEKHIRQNQAMVRNRRYAQMTPDDLPVAQESKTQLFYIPAVYLAVFGLLGGLLAGAGGAVMHLAPDRQHQADQAMQSIRDIRKLVKTSTADYGITAQQADDAIHDIVINAGNNPYLAIEMDDSLSAAEKQQRLHELSHGDHLRTLITNIIGFGLCGIFISIGLSVAEPVIDRNMHAAIINGSIGATLGLFGGLAASLVVDRIYEFIGGADHGAMRQILAQSASWGVLGTFLAIAPGVVARNKKRLLIGVAGGAIGGVVGGLVLDPLTQSTGSLELSRLIAMCCIGALIGAATGIFEQATRTGWLKVTAGFISGKQFILYRNPTYIGSAPDCQIFLFKDPKVGRRHAAIHLNKGRVEIEDLPLGAPTYINRQPINRQRLRHGDQITIGNTIFLYQEKSRKPVAV